jgi:putative acetyltransferase
MTVTFTLRNETPADIGAITEVTMAAFETLAISQHTEQFVVAALRAAGRSRCRSSPKPGAE